ncbi:glycosyltransferase family 2 protein [Pseudoroseicyclus tamaricis]|uniref:Glycosyltransferase family 2 protein n=1 Tax=Pseudoroseicyclus tamaricis TaxID=2705421 RepID=A0A6B2K285_9RHOB|nr:glycosyltransferase family 2 protein [Pseudoroseicyclus tamaricis]NDV00536.1 glycosyltransferase family 2 protein [Pseudoroseicyclus tamaricis]
MPRFSIIMPCFNAADTLEDTLQSIALQTNTDWELICIDDWSSDCTPRILARAAADPRVRVLINKGKGPSRARNDGVAVARGEIIAFCDADDIWAHDKLERMAEVMDDGRFDGAYARVAFFRGSRSTSQSTVTEEPLSVQVLMGENPVCTMSNLVVRRSAFQLTEGFDTTMVHNEDLEWLIRAVAKGLWIQGIDETLVHYRTSVTGLSSDLQAMEEGRRKALRTAAGFGYEPDPRAEAIHLRYLARRALRVGAPASEALRLAAAGIKESPRGFFSDLRRGSLTALGAVTAPLLPAPVRRALFAS